MQTGYDHSYYFINTYVKDHVEFHATQMGLAARE
jgi:S-formylglutathione hydrolase FrmB